METLKKLLPLVLLIAISWYTHVFTMMNQRPQSVHMWAMCDRGSVARNYAQESMNFFQPRVHEAKNGEGICGMEFPIMNYSAAIFYKLFGFNELWYRLLMFIVYSFGLVAAYYTTGYFLNNVLNRILVTAIFASSPVLTYYAANFIPDTAALGFTMLSWFFFFKWRDKGKKYSIMLFFLFLSLAVLVKITAAIGAIILLGATLFSLIFKNFKFDFGRVKKGLLLSVLLISLSLAFGWIQYSKYLNEKYGLSVFLMRTMTPSSWEEVVKTLKHVNEIWVQFYFSKPLYLLLLVGFLVFAFYIKRVSFDLRFISLCYLCGVVSFAYLMLIQFNDHDYYIITLLPLIYFIILSSFQVFEKVSMNLSIKKSIPVLFILILLFNMNFNRKHQEFRMSEHCWLFDWARYVPYQEVEPYIKEIGLNRNNKAIAICDYSPNIALYFLNLKGWSVADVAPDESIQRALEFKPAYLITEDTMQTRRSVFNNLRLMPIGQYKTIRIYTINY